MTPEARLRMSDTTDGRGHATATAPGRAVDSQLAQVIRRSVEWFLSAQSREGYWDSARLGAGAAPIRTAEGWLEIYHGATKENRYCLGALLLDLDEPWRVIARSETPIMEPLASYEQEGFFGQVIFTNGHLVDGDNLTLYYGAADSVICAAQISIADILAGLTLAEAVTT